MTHLTADIKNLNVKKLIESSQFKLIQFNIVNIFGHNFGELFNI